MLARAGFALLVVAVLVSTVLSVWPVVAEAPWEEEAIPTAQAVEQPTDDLRAVRCAAALDLRNTASAMPEFVSEPSGTRVGTFLRKTGRDSALAQANREIKEYCE